MYVVMRLCDRMFYDGTSWCCAIAKVYAADEVPTLEGCIALDVSKYLRR